MTNQPPSVLWHCWLANETLPPQWLILCRVGR